MFFAISDCSNARNDLSDGAGAREKALEKLLPSNAVTFAGLS